MMDTGSFEDMLSIPSLRFWNGLGGNRVFSGICIPLGPLQHTYGLPEAPRDTKKQTIATNNCSLPSMLKEVAKTKR